jgi:sulfur-carrier protein adenylyltransferase/sulfurtransferase
MKLSRDQKERYKRQTILEQVGEDGQLRLLAARVLIVGLGGLGAPVASYLTAAGVGTIGLIDADTVDKSNLQRQVIFSEKQVGQAKVQAARTRLIALNPDVKINMQRAFIDEKNAETILADYDLVVDCSDNFAARYAINDACLTQGKAFVFGSLYRFEGQVSLFCAALDGPCYRCFYPQTRQFASVSASTSTFACADDDIPNCAEAGILGSLAGVVGSLQATEAIKYLLGLGDSLAGRVLMYDGLSMRFSNLNLPTAADCLCQQSDMREGREQGTRISDLLAERVSFSNEPVGRDFSSSSSSSSSFSSASRSSRASAGADRSITVAELAEILDEDDQSIELIDVRELKEHRAMRLRNSTLLPLNELVERIDEVGGERPIVVYCRSGTRSRKACGILRDCGFTDVRNLTGGIMAWYREFEEKNIDTDAGM